MVSQNSAAVQLVDVIVVGAGFAGLYMLYRLRQMGFRALVLEAGEEVGGTWYWNRYPGARCDVDSVEYQLGFPDFLQREWSWTERYATQPEIRRYLRFVSDRLNLRCDIRFNKRVVSADFDSATAQWTLVTEHGSELTAQYCVMATGCLSIAQTPAIPGVAQFTGDVFHTGAWPDSVVDFTGRRVAVIGTGSSGIQAITSIANQAAQLYVLQRTPTYVFPSYNGALDPEYVKSVKETFATQRELCRHTWGGTLLSFSARGSREMSEQERNAELESRWSAGGGFSFLGAYADMLTDPEANEFAAEFVRKKIRQIIPDPVLAEQLTPRGFPIGTKRICLGSEYYETFLRPNVKLIELRQNPIARIVPSGIVCGDTELRVDGIVFATGFDAMTGALAHINITAQHNSLAKKWADGPITYLGLAVAGFPNIFMITGPGSPSVLSNVVVSIEQHVDWIVNCLDAVRGLGAATIEATPEAEAQWTAHVEEVAQYTLFPKANSWYMGANVPGKKRRFMPYVGGVHTYRDKCDTVARDQYEGFEIKAHA